MTRVPLNKLRFSRECWPRFTLDAVRVVMFTALMVDGVAFDPIIVVPKNDGTYLVADGVHRWQAAVKAGLTDLIVIIMNPMTAETVEQCAYRIALDTSTKSALPLSNPERHRAVLHLATVSPHLSHREIARLVGVAHSTVDRWVREGMGTKDPGSDSGSSTASYTPGPTSDDVARRIATYLDKLDDARSLFDMAAQSRMGKHLAGALADRFGDDALHQAERFASWINGAVTQLRAQG